jgi:transposase
MIEFELSHKERAALVDLIGHTIDARLLRRAYAILWFDEGESVSEVAEQLKVSRRSVYHWLEHFVERMDLPVDNRLNDADRSGRPATVQGVIDPLIDAIIDTVPRTLGYPSTVWTVALLVRYLAEKHKLQASAPSVRLALARLDIHWKRPRHHLALRSATWRQAKGGLNMGYSRRNARLF